MFNTRSKRILSLVNNIKQNEKSAIEDTNYINNCPVQVAVEETDRNMDEISPVPDGTENLDAVEETDRNMEMSPVPAGAENIDVEMREVWQVVFDNSDDDVCSEKVQDEANLSSQVRSNENISENMNITDQPTPFNIEEPSSFENSPSMRIEELDRSINSTPVNIELDIPTPMPAVVNDHNNCNSDFCPDHSCSSPTTSMSAGATADSSDSMSTPQRHQKKRLRRRNEWSEVKRKCLKNLGQKYVSKKGKLVEEKTMRRPCKCRYKCHEKIPNDQRLESFSRFWKLGNREKQWAFIVKYCDKIKKKRRLNKDSPNIRIFTYKYFLPITSAESESESGINRVDVCQTMFLNTLCISSRMIRTAWEKYDGTTITVEDNRGRHRNHRVVLNEEMIRSVCDHVNSFAPVESHYVRKDSTKLYLDGDLNMAKMHRLYLEWFDDSKYANKASKLRQYRDIVKEHFNLGFHIPKKDQCDECHIFRNNQTHTEDELEKYKKHIDKKKLSRHLKSQDKQEAFESDGKILTAVFDFEKVLTCPHGQISIFYYKRKLSCYNFTVFDMGKKKAVCYMWDETIAKRGANEVSSCLLAFIEMNAREGVKDFRFWSDNCTGQNRNRIVFSLYLYASCKFNVSITHRFLEKGHTQNEADSVHSLIERGSQTRVIYTPEEWRLLVRWAKTEGEPYVVRNVVQDDIYDFKSLLNNKVWLKNIKGEKISWISISEVHTESGDANKLYYKYDLAEEQYDTLIIRGNTRNSSLVGPKHAYTGPLKISKEKYKDLVNMCETGIIPAEYSSYFKSLPHFSSTQSSVSLNESDDD